MTNLQQLTITAYADPFFSVLASVRPNPMTVAIDPDVDPRAATVSDVDTPAAGETVTALAPDGEHNEALTLSLILDGTAGDAPATTVDIALADLRGLVVNTDTHWPRFLTLARGALLFKGRLQALTIKYTRFAPDGSPASATVQACFVGRYDCAE